MRTDWAIAAALLQRCAGTLRGIRTAPRLLKCLYSGLLRRSRLNAAPRAGPGAAKRGNAPGGLMGPQRTSIHLDSNMSRPTTCKSHRAGRVSLRTAGRELRRCESSRKTARQLSPSARQSTAPRLPSSESLCRSTATDSRGGDIRQDGGSRPHWGCASAWPIHPALPGSSPALVVPPAASL